MIATDTIGPGEGCISWVDISTRSCNSALNNIHQYSCNSPMILTENKKSIIVLLKKTLFLIFEKCSKYLLYRGVSEEKINM
jgi:hypothetical protein